MCGTEAVVTFKPCGHAVICAGCADRVKKCPTCKVLYMHACMHTTPYNLYVTGFGKTIPKSINWVSYAILTTSQEGLVKILSQLAKLFLRYDQKSHITSHCSTLETSQKFCILMLNVRWGSHTTASQPLWPPFLFRYFTTCTWQFCRLQLFVHAECSKRMKYCFQCKTTLLRDFRKLSYIIESIWMEVTRSTFITM